MTIGFIGGTGPEGRGLGLRFAMAGEEVMIGSRDEARAQEAAQRILKAEPVAAVTGGANLDVARVADPVFLTVPYEAQAQSLAQLGDALSGKSVVSVVAPLTFSKGVARALAVAEGSAALAAQAALPDSTIVAAFQTISAHDLLDRDMPVESDVVVCSDGAQAKTAIMSLAQKISGVRALDGGRLQNAEYVEGFTALLLNLNRTYKTRTAIRIVGIPEG